MNELRNCCFFCVFFFGPNIKGEWRYLRTNWTWHFEGSHFTAWARFHQNDLAAWFHRWYSSPVWLYLSRSPSLPPSLFLSDTTLTAHGVASQSRHCARRTPCFSPRCEPSSTGNTLHQGCNLGRRPGAMLIRFVFQISAPPMRLYLAEETRCSNHLHFAPAALLYHTDRLQRGTLKSRIGYPSPSSPSLSIKMAGLGGESQTCDTHQI